MAGFSDALWTAPENSVIVVVTDCLSGSLAGARWRFRSASDKGGRYRDQALADLQRLEDRHQAVLYVWVHSHRRFFLTKIEHVVFIYRESLFLCLTQTLYFLSSVRPSALPQGSPPIPPMSFNVKCVIVHISPFWQKAQALLLAQHRHAFGH